MLNKRAALFVLGSALASALVACGQSGWSNAGNSPSPASSASPARTGLTLNGTVDVGEAVALHAPFQAAADVLNSQSPTPAPLHMTCAQFAQGVNGTFVAPVFDVKTNDHRVYFQAFLSNGYAGPGSYSSAAQPALAGTVAIAVGVDPGQTSAVSIYRSQINGSSTMLVRPDGSGTFTFTEWGSDEVRGDTGSAASVTGAVTWTCA